MIVQILRKMTLCVSVLDIQKLLYMHKLEIFFRTKDIGNHIEIRFKFEHYCYDLMCLFVFNLAVFVFWNHSIV